MEGEPINWHIFLFLNFSVTTGTAYDAIPALVLLEGCVTLSPVCLYKNRRRNVYMHRSSWFKKGAENKQKAETEAK